MGDSYKTLAQGVLPAATATMYTVPGATQTIVRNLTLSNYSGVSANVSLYRNGSTAPFLADGVITVPAGGHAEWDGSRALETGATIRGGAIPPGTVSFTLDGDEIT